MQIQLHTPVCLNEKGQRDYNQDSIFPAPLSATTSARFFMVCDGVGGSSRGEIASKSICEAFGSYFAGRSHFSQEELQAALDLAVKKMQHFIAQNKEGESMASTLTFLGFGEQGLTFGHVGDSRIYHFRAGRIHFKTRDHSLMNEWIDQGVIQEREALTHPKRNVVTRAVVASGKKIEIDTHFAGEVQPGDHFFLCSDGILEALSEDELTALICGTGSDSEKMEAIKEACQKQSRDNFSAYLLQVKAVDSGSGDAPAPKGIRDKEKRTFLLTAGFVLLFLVVLFASLTSSSSKEDNEEAEGAETMESKLEELRLLDTLSIEPTDVYDDTPTE